MATGIPKVRSLPRRLEIEFAKLLCTLGLRDYGCALWNIALNRPDDIQDAFPTSISDAVLQQIMDQSRHDPAVLAAGAKALPFLRASHAPDFSNREACDVGALFDSITEPPDIVLLTAQLIVGDSEKYSADILSVLGNSGARSILVIVTDQKAEDAGAWNAHAAFEPFTRARLIFWKDFFQPGHGLNPVFLALFVHALGPSTILVNGGWIGLEMIARHGRALSRFHRILCTFFSLGAPGFPPEWAILYPRRIAPFATIVTDNDKTAAVLEQRYKSLFGPGLFVIPPGLVPVDETLFRKRLRARLERVCHRKRLPRWAWVSRIHPSKGTDILKELAKSRPADKFDLFGPLHASTDMRHLAGPNIAYKGEIHDISAADFSDYDGFIFTSLYEGMPNIVLEMSQHAIPMILSDVGGLAETFDTCAVKFIRIGGENDAIVKAFADACDAVLGLTTKAIADMASAAREQAIIRHDPAAFAARVVDIFGGHSEARRRNLEAEFFFGSKTSAAERTSRDDDDEHLLSISSSETREASSDITAVIVFHREGAFALPALASFSEMIGVAREADISVEAVAMLDRVDDVTHGIIKKNGSIFDRVEEVSFGDLGLTRNAAAARACGRYLAFFDGDDLWGAVWLKYAYLTASLEANDGDSIWHPENVYHFDEGDFEENSVTKVPRSKASSHHYILHSSDESGFDKRILLLGNLWTAHAFARRSVFIRFPYRPNDKANGIGVEDWRWNLETLAGGIRHRIIPDAVHLLRTKQSGSLNRELQAIGVLPLL